jgi:hypothetical protein
MTQSNDFFSKVAELGEYPPFLLSFEKRINLMMMHIPRLSIREKRFDSHTGQITPTSTTTTTTTEQKISIVQVCELLCVPLIQMGSLIRIAGEAKVLCECSMIARKIQKGWPLYTLALATLQTTVIQHQKNDEDCVEQFYRSTFPSLFVDEMTPLAPLLVSVSLEQQLSIQRLHEKFTTWFQQLYIIRDKLENFADLNASVADDFARQNVEQIAKQKRMICDIENAMVSRIDWILSGCSSDRIPDMRSWDELFGQVTREPQQQTQQTQQPQITTQVLSINENKRKYVSQQNSDNEDDDDTVAEEEEVVSSQESKRRKVIDKNDL